MKSLCADAVSQCSHQKWWRSSLQHHATWKVRRIMISASTMLPTWWFQLPPSLLYNREVSSCELDADFGCGCDPYSISCRTMTKSALLHATRISLSRINNIIIINQVKCLIWLMTRPSLEGTRGNDATIQACWHPSLSINSETFIVGAHIFFCVCNRVQMLCFKSVNVAK